MDWSGFYVGGHIGGIFSDTTYSLPAIIQQPTGTPDDTDESVTGGAQVGWNLQTNSDLVLGVEADVSFFDLESGGSRSFQNNSGTDFFQSVTTEHDWLATFRGRSGLTVGDEKRTLVYATGGLALVGSKISGTYSRLNGNNPFSFADSNTATEVSFALGGGVEHAVTDSLSFKLEGLYVGLDTMSVLVQAPNGVARSFEASADLYLARFGVNWHF